MLEIAEQWQHKNVPYPQDWKCAIWSTHKEICLLSQGNMTYVALLDQEDLTRWLPDLPFQPQAFCDFVILGFFFKEQIGQAHLKLCTSGISISGTWAEISSKWKQTADT